MAEQMRPASNEQAPDPSSSYERSHPEEEAGMGQMDSNAHATPTARPDDGMNAAIPQKQNNRQINAHDVINEGATAKPGTALPEQPDHSMLDEEPDGWDLAPNDISDPKQKRHPRTEGKGGTP